MNPNFERTVGNVDDPATRTGAAWSAEMVAVRNFGLIDDGVNANTVR